MGFLVLSRKSGQAVVMNKVISVRVLAVMGDRVKLGFYAPDDVEIAREELLIEAGITPPDLQNITARADA